jgi:hypothetical protein
MDKREPFVRRLPSDQAKALLDALDAGWSIESDPEKIVARYKDYDLAETVPRVIMYMDLGALKGRIDALEEFIVKKGYKLAEIA